MDVFDVYEGRTVRSTQPPELMKDEKLQATVLIEREAFKIQIYGLLSYAPEAPCVRGR